MTTNRPLCIDLDGTLTPTDTLIESTLKLVKQQPLAIGKLPFWLFKGRAYLKQQVVRHAQIDVTLLPYNQELIEYIKSQRATGTPIVLVTASDQHLADVVASHLGIFDQVLGSDGTHNFSAGKKADLLSRTFGHKQFIYAGNSPADLPVWKQSAAAIVVNAPRWLATKARQVAPIEKIFPPASHSLKRYLKAIRIHQWLKNLLLFVPLIAGHQITNGFAITATFVAFISFSFMASAIYLMNDLLDLEADRKHTTKKHRPFAAGTIHPLIGMAASTLLATASVSLGLFVPNPFMTVLIWYVIINLAYSGFLKQVALVDVIILASLYALRIFAGSAATGIITSSWLFVFAMFMFLSLALVKRFTEVDNLQKNNQHKAAGRGYTSADRIPLAMLGISSGYLSLLVLALYITSGTVATLYTKPYLLWLLIPLLMLWISRVWLLAYRGQVHEDPILFATKDMTSYAVAAGMVFTLIIAT